MSCGQWIIVEIEETLLKHRLYENLRAAYHKTVLLDVEHRSGCAEEIRAAHEKSIQRLSLKDLGGSMDVAFCRGTGRLRNSVDIFSWSVLRQLF